MRRGQPYQSQKNRVQVLLLNQSIGKFSVVELNRFSLVVGVGCSVTMYGYWGERRWRYAEGRVGVPTIKREKFPGRVYDGEETSRNSENGHTDRLPTSLVPLCLRLNFEVEILSIDTFKPFGESKRLGVQDGYLLLHPSCIYLCRPTQTIVHDLHPLLTWHYQIRSQTRRGSHL